MYVQAAELVPFSGRLNLSYPGLQPVRHRRDESVPNTVVEENLTYTYKERDLVTEDRCSRSGFFPCILSTSHVICQLCM